MSSKFKRKITRTIKRRLQDRNFVLVLLVIVLCVGLIGYSTYMNNRRLSVNPESYTPLLQLIARAESSDNYNAYFNNSRNSSIKFTDMSINDVLAWQSNHVQQGNFSSAVGRYQIVNTTLSGLVKQLKIDTKQKFDHAMQDRLAIALLERRGSEKYINKEITREEFAANLAMEWAALPKVIGEKPGDSYYSGDGVNKSRLEVSQVLKAIEPIRPK